MGVDKFAVVLDTPDATFAPGNSVTGSVELDTDGNEYVYDIEITFAGTAYTHYTDWRMFWLREGHTAAKSRNPNNREHYNNYYYYHHPPVSYDSNNSLFQSSKTLFGNNKNYVSIPEGIQRFPFSFQLPPTSLPHTCRIGTNSYVSYGLVAVLTKPWYRCNQRSTPKHIRVVSPVNLNAIIGTNGPVTVEKVTKFGYWFWESDPLRLTATVSHAGCNLGDNLQVSISLDNGSNTGLTDVGVELLREWTLSASAGHWSGSWVTHWKEYNVISEVKKGESLNPGRKSTWNTFLTMPSHELPSLFCDTCETVRMRYLVKVTAYVNAWFSSNIVVEIPVTIGTSGR